MFRLVSSLVAVFSLAASASTLEKLSLEEMSQKSNLVIRGRVVEQGLTIRANLMYTRYRIQVSESLKGAAAKVIDVAVPGATLGRIQQNIAGAPKLSIGSEYVIFVWSGTSGINHIIGLSQGLFDVKTDAQGTTIVSRGAIEEPMVDQRGQSVTSPAVTMSYRSLADQVRTGAAKQ